VKEISSSEHSEWFSSSFSYYYYIYLLHTPAEREFAQVDALGERADVGDARVRQVKVGEVRARARECVCRRDARAAQVDVLEEREVLGNMAHAHVGHARASAREGGEE